MKIMEGTSSGNTAFTVGEEYPIGNFRGIDGAVFNYSGGKGILAIGFQNMTDEEHRLINEFPGRVGLFMYGNAIFITYKFGKLVGDCAYNLYMNKSGTPEEVREPIEGLGMPFYILAVESTTNIIRSMRMCGMGTRWTQQFKKFYDEQREVPFDEEKFSSLVADLQRRYTSRDLFRMSHTYKLGSHNSENSDKIT